MKTLPFILLITTVVLLSTYAYAVIYDPSPDHLFPEYDHYLVTIIICSDVDGDGDLDHLKGDYPNPFNPTTTIRFDLPEKSRVRLQIFNVLGRQVATLIDSELDPGYKKVRWDSMSNSISVASGIYFYRIDAKGLNTGKRFVKTSKMVLIK